MDSLHAIGFYVSAALAVMGGLIAAFLSNRTQRALALAAAGLGVTGIYVFLSAAFAGLVTLVCFAGCALLLARPDYRPIEPAVTGSWRQVGALAAAALVVVLAYSAFRGRFTFEEFSVDAIGSAAVGTLLFARDAMATVAIAALALAALVGATALWRTRDRTR